MLTVFLDRFNTAKQFKNLKNACKMNQVTVFWTENMSMRQARKDVFKYFKDNFLALKYFLVQEAVLYPKLIWVYLVIAWYDGTQAKTLCLESCRL